MRNRFDAQLEQLHQKLIEMGNLCEQVISMTYRVLMDEDYKAASEIMEKDSLIDLKERDIEGLCLKLLLQQQPVASDLRKVSAALTYGPRTHGIHSKAKLDEIVETSLRNAAIWDEVKDRLKKSALGMSGGQQQRLCIARALAVQPEVLLMDEPTSALDPISTSKIEDLAVELKKAYTIIMVTHNMQQAARISDKTAFFLLGEVIEYNDTETLFSLPKDKRTEDYITGRFG